MRRRLGITLVALAAVVVAVALLQRERSREPTTPLVREGNSAAPSTLHVGEWPEALASTRSSVAAERSALVRFVNESTGQALDGDGEVLLADERGALRRSPIVGGATAAPHGLPQDERLLVLGVDIDGETYTYLDLDASWEDLVSRSPVPVSRGIPVPARLFVGKEGELTSAVRIGTPKSGTVRIGGAIYRDLDATVRSPIALPHRDGGGLVELVGSSAWGRVQVPAPPPPAAPAQFARIELQRTLELAVVLHAPEPLEGLTLTFVREIDALEGSETTKGTLALGIQRQDWIRGPSDWLIERSFADVLAGSYTPTFLQMPAERGLTLAPPRVAVGFDLPRRIELWIDGGEPAVRVHGRVHLRFPIPIAEVRSLAGQVDVTLRALEPQQILTGQPAVLRVPLRTAAASAFDERTIVLARDEGLAAGEYELGVRPLGFVHRLVLGAHTPLVLVDVPGLGRVELRDGDRAADASGSSGPFPRVTPKGHQPPPTEPPLVEALEEAPGKRAYLLAYGDYALSNVWNAFIGPEEFEVDGPETTVTFRREPTYSRLLAWELAGQRVELPLAAMGGVTVLDEGTPLPAALVTADGYTLEKGTMSALRVSIERPGIYDVEYRLVLPGGRKVTKRVESLAFGAEELAPVVLVLDE